MPVNLSRESFVTVQVTPTLVFQARPDAVAIHLENRSSVQMYLTFDPTITLQDPTTFAFKGFELDPGDSVELTAEEDGDAVNSAIYAQTQNAIGHLHVMQIVPSAP